MNVEPLPPSLTHADRSYSLFAVRAELFTHALVIRQGKKRDVYAVDEFTNPEDESVRTFVIVRCGGTQEDGIYRVFIGPKWARCNCVGFGRWGNCKHADALYYGTTGGNLVPDPPRPYRDREGYHRHQCPTCEAVWEHTDTVVNLPFRERVAAHTCPACGVGFEGEKYHGTAQPVAVCHHVTPTGAPL